VYTWRVMMRSPSGRCSTRRSIGRVPRPMLFGLTILALSNCSTEACDCPPGIVPALVTGHVVREGGTPVPEAIVHALSSPAAGCESLDIDLGLEVTGADGAFGCLWRQGS
jgi:hypothetical protein